MKEKSISKKTHAKILGVQYGIYKIIYDRGWDDAMHDYTNDDKPEATKKEIKAWESRKQNETKRKRIDAHSDAVEPET